MEGGGRLLPWHICPLVKPRLTVPLPGAPGAGTPAGTTVCGPVANEGAKANIILLEVAKTRAGQLVANRSQAALGRLG
jgi:hypothetical protein